MHGKFISARVFNFQLECTCYTPAKEVEGVGDIVFCGVWLIDRKPYIVDSTRIKTTSSIAYFFNQI